MAQDREPGEELPRRTGYRWDRRQFPSCRQAEALAAAGTSLPPDAAGPDVRINAIRGAPAAMHSHGSA